LVIAALIVMIAMAAYVYLALRWWNHHCFDCGGR
jgi:hypothetical protein